MEGNAAGLRARKHAQKPSISSLNAEDEKGNDADTETLRGDPDKILGRTPNGTGERPSIVEYAPASLI
jgi:hypothetical protein